MSSIGQIQLDHRQTLPAKMLSGWLDYGSNDAAIIEVGCEAVVVALDWDFPKLEKTRPKAALTARGGAQNVASGFSLPVDFAIRFLHAGLVSNRIKKLVRSGFSTLKVSLGPAALHCRLKGYKAKLDGHCKIVIAGQIQL